VTLAAGSRSDPRRGGVSGSPSQSRSSIGQEKGWPLIIGGVAGVCGGRRGGSEGTRGDDDSSRRGRGDAVAVARAPPSPDPHPAARTAARDGGGDGGTRTEGPRSAAGRTRRRRVDVFGCPCPLWDSGAGATKTGRMGTGDSTAGSHGENGERKENPKPPCGARAASLACSTAYYSVPPPAAVVHVGPGRGGVGSGWPGPAPGPNVSRCVGGAITTRCGAGWAPALRARLLTCRRAAD
jgi:hypothetical protein